MADLTKHEIEAAIDSAAQIETAMRPFTALRSVLQVALDWATSRDAAAAQVRHLQHEIDPLALKKQEAQVVYDTFIQTLTEQKRDERKRFEAFQAETQAAVRKETETLKAIQQQIVENTAKLTALNLEYDTVQQQVKQDLANAEKSMARLTTTMGRK